MVNAVITRAESWAFQTSTIGGVAAIAAAAAGGGVDALTGLPWIASLVGLVVAGIVAIVMPGHDPSVLVAAAQDLETTIAGHAVALTKATTSATDATNALKDVAPKIAAQVSAVATQVSNLAPIVSAVAAATGKVGPNFSTIVTDAGTVAKSLE